MVAIVLAPHNEASSSTLSSRAESRGLRPPALWAGGGGVVDHSRFAGENFLTDPAGDQLAASVDQMTKAAVELVELLDCRRVSWRRCGRACIHPQSAILGTLDAVLINRSI